MKGWMVFGKSRADLTDEDYSARRLLEAAASKGVDLEIYAPSQFDLVVNRLDNRSVIVDGESKPLPDFVLPRMGSATTYFALSILRQMETLGIHTINSASSIELVRDKLHVSQLLAQTGLPTPKTMLGKPMVDCQVVSREVGFPCVIKNLSGTQGKGIYLCDDEDRFVDIMDLIYTNNPNANIIYQEYVSCSHGRDIRVFVVGGRVIGGMKRVAKKGFKANVSLGGDVEAFEVGKELELLSLEVCRVLNLEVAGVDFLFTENGYTICEANSAPGFIGMERAIGRTVAEEIIDYILVRCGASDVLSRGD